MNLYLYPSKDINSMLDKFDEEEFDVADDVPYRIVAVVEGKDFPQLFVIDEKWQILVQELKNDFKNAKFEPILIASGVTKREFEHLKDSNPDYSSGFIYEQCGDRFFIVDLVTEEHSYYSSALMRGWLSALKEQFKEGGNAFFFSNFLIIDEMLPDCSFNVKPEATLKAKYSERPLAVLEVAWMESSMHLNQKMQKWLDLGVLWAIGIDRSFTRNCTRVFVRQLGFDDCIFDWSFAVGKTVEFDLILSKEVLFKRANLRNEDLHCGKRNFSLPVKMKIL